MDFKLVFENLLTGFDKYNVRYGLIGGFALGLYGVSRSTMDLDFLVHLDDLPKIDNIMQELGYERSFRSENVSQFISPLKVFGEIDFIHAFRETSLKMLQRAEDKKIFDTLSIKVLKLEDIIGFKIQAIANDPARRPLDLSDIESLMALYRSSIDWNTLDGYFAMFKMTELFIELRRKFSNDN
jgi:hypothetical protein